jgi:hypothetical protein
MAHKWGTRFLFPTHLARLDEWATRRVRGCAAQVAGPETAVDIAQGEADAVAVGEWRRWVKLELGQSEGAEQFAESRGFAVELLGVREVLELAAAAGAEVRTGWSGEP